MTPSVGVIKGTTGDVFVQANMPGAKSFALQRRDDVIHEFARRRIHLYIDDAAAAAYIVSQNEAELTGLWMALHEEPLAWALRRDDTEMLETVNAVLAGWRRERHPGPVAAPMASVHARGEVGTDEASHHGGARRVSGVPRGSGGEA